jgi:peptidoglycan/xylan/chitin deacetylase (PgdA/CDA1 family)
MEHQLQRTVREGAIVSPVIILRGLDALYYSQLYRLADRMISGVGAIFCFHRVTEHGHRSGFAPNAELELHTAFLEELLKMARTERWDIVTLDEVRRRLVERSFARKFVCFTIDDVYQDTQNLAFPLFQRYDAPFTAFVTAGIPERSFPIWWFGLEQILRVRDALWVIGPQGPRRLNVAAPEAKMAAFVDLVDTMRRCSSPTAAFADLCRLNDLTAAELADDIGVTWEGLKAMSDSGLVEVGAHTVNHPCLADLPSDEAEWEMVQSRRLIEERVGCPVRHFAFPYGHAPAAGPRDFAMAKALGFATAVTTRKRVLVPADAERLHALPRLVLNGHFQKRRYAKVFMSGVLGPIESAMLWLSENVGKFGDHKKTAPSGLRTSKGNLIKIK